MRKNLKEYYQIFKMYQKVIQMYNREHIEALELFNEKAEKLRNCRFTKTLFKEKSGFRMSMKKDKPIETERWGPDEDSIDAFVLTFRFFIQDNEKSSFTNMAKIYDKLSISKKKKVLFKDARNNLNKFLDSTPVAKIVINGKSFTHRDIYEIFIYGGLSHANESKKTMYDLWMNTPLRDMAINNFVYILGTVMNFISYVQNLNKEVIKELKTNDL